MAKGVPPPIENITFYPEGITMLGFYENPFEGIDSFIKYMYSLLSLEDISYFKTPKFVYSQLSDAYICTESFYKWIYFSEDKGLKRNTKWIRDNIVKIMNSEYYSFELKLEKNTVEMEMLLYHPSDKKLLSFSDKNYNVYINAKIKPKSSLKSNSIVSSYLYEKSLFEGQLTIILNNQNDYKMNGIINVVLPQLIIPQFYKQKIMVNSILNSKLSEENVFNIYELKNKKSMLYTQNITLNEKSNYIWVIPYKKTFMSLKNYPSNCAHGLDVPPIEFITTKTTNNNEDNRKIYHSTLSTTIFPYPDFSMIYNMVCFISACLCLLVTQILSPISFIPKMKDDNKKEDKVKTN